MGAQVGNLSCVLQQLNMLTPALQPNLAFITGGWWDIIDLPTVVLLSTDGRQLISHFSDFF